MVKQHRQLMQFCLGIFDLMVVTECWLLAYKLRLQFPARENVPVSFHQVQTNLPLAWIATLAVLVGMGLYKPQRDKSFLLELGQIIRASVLAWLVLLAAVVIVNDNGGPGQHLSMGMLLLFLPCLMSGLVLERGIFRIVLRLARRRGWNQRHALIVGTGRLAQNTLSRIIENSWTGIRVAGFVDLSPTERQSVCGLPVLGGTEDIVKIVEAQGIDCVFVALSSKHGEHLPQIIDDLEQTPVDLRIVPDLYISRFPMQVAVNELQGLPILSLRENPLAGWPMIYKRMFDITGALFGLLLLGLPMLGMALLIKLTSPGPVIYRQKRMSVGGRPFDMLKFRTMFVDAEGTEGAEVPMFAMRNDPRCTKVGRWLRSLSLDELPQLLNVIKGDMSLVGPRPERPEMMEKIQREIPGFPIRMKVRAGLTGWAQVNGFRGRTSFRKRLQYDLYYLNHWSPMLDLRIVVATVFRGFWHPNAY